MKKHFFTIAVLALFFPSASFSQGWHSISNFGSNPGNLNAYEYVPANMPTNAPLLVVIHGCSQDAAGFAAETEWNKLAEFHKFYLVYPEQKSANNSGLCFNYWESGDVSRGQGEAKSMKQMVDYMKSHYSIDSTRVFVTGLSAGGAMTAVMLAVYPDVFAAGAEMAGLPYKVATSQLEVYTAAVGLTSKTPQEWGDLVRAQFPGFTGSYPRLVIVHGTADIVINKNNSEEMMKQFTNLHHTDQNADYTDNAFNGNSVVQLKQYEDTNGQVVIERYTIDNMGHGTPVDPGPCFDQGGTTTGVGMDVNFYSCFYAAKFFGILQPPFAISGLDSVTESAEGVGYSVTGHAGSSYDWQVAGGTIANGQGTSSIAVDWADSTGAVSLTETTSDGCTLGPVGMDVLINIEEPIDTTPIDTTTATTLVAPVEEGLIVTQANGQTEYIVKSAIKQRAKIQLFNVDGKVIFTSIIPVNQVAMMPTVVAGIYLIRCDLEEHYYVRKVVVK